MLQVPRVSDGVVKRQREHSHRGRRNAVTFDPSIDLAGLVAQYEVIQKARDELRKATSLSSSSSLQTSPCLLPATPFPSNSGVISPPSHHITADNLPAFLLPIEQPDEGLEEVAVELDPGLASKIKCSPSYSAPSGLLCVFLIFEPV